VDVQLKPAGAGGAHEDAGMQQHKLHNTKKHAPSLIEREKKEQAAQHTIRRRRGSEFRRGNMLLPHPRPASYAS